VLRYLSAADDLGSLPSNQPQNIQVLSQKYAGHMNAIASLHGKLQLQGLARYKGQSMIDAAIHAINQHKDNPQHPLHGCEWKGGHSKLGNKHETDKHFSSGLHKIQTGKERTLNALEKVACQWLLKENNPAYKAGAEDDAAVEEVTPTAEVEEEAFSFGDLLASSAESAEKEKEKTESDYVNTDHLLSSASIAECLWSKFDALVPQRREGMSPIVG